MPAGEKILIVEDNAFVRMQAASYLQAGGYGVIEAENGGHALRLLNPNIALIIVDVRMAPIDGFELIKSIRGKDTVTPLIMMTGDQNPDILNEASKWSVSAVLMKPVEKDRLLSMVERAIAKADAIKKKTV